jgi:putative transposase
MRKLPLIKGNYYLIYNTGNNSSNIFFDEIDRARMLFSLLYFQSDEKVSNVSFQTNSYSERKEFSLRKNTVERIIKNRSVELISFTLNPECFILLIKQTEKDGIADYMQRVSNSYTKYFNSRYGKSGHLFSGPYKAFDVPAESLVLTSVLIHREIGSAREWRGREHKYPWSSYQDYINHVDHGNHDAHRDHSEQKEQKNGNRWKGLLLIEEASLPPLPSPSSPPSLPSMTPSQSYRAFVENAQIDELKKTFKLA